MPDDGASRVRRNAVYLFVGVVIANLSSFLFRVILAREFGPQGFGVFSLALMVTSVATMFGLLGLPDGVITFVSKSAEREQYDRVAGATISSIAVSLSTAVVLSVGVVLLAPALSTRVFDTPALTDVLWWFAWVIPANVLIDISAAYFLGIERGWYNTAIKQVVPKVLLFVFVLVVVFFDGPLVAVGSAYLLATAVAALVGLSAVARELPTGSLTDASVDIRELLNYSLPLLATSAIGLLLTWTDTMVLGLLRGSTAVGVYQSAFLLAMNLHVVLGAISGSLYPNFGSLLARGETSVVQHRFTQGTRWALLITVAPAAYLIGFSTLSLGMLFGQAFESGATPLIILVISQGLIISFGPATNLLKAAEETRYVAITYGIAAVVNLVLNFTLIPLVGLVGAAAATTSSLILGNYFHFRRVRSHVDVEIPLDPLFRATIAGVLAYLPCAYIAQYIESIPTFLGHIALFSVVYVFALAAVGGFNRSELWSAFSEISKIS